MWSDDTRTDTGGKQDHSMAKNSSVEKIIPSESHGGRQFAYGDEHSVKAMGGGDGGGWGVLGSEENMWKMSAEAEWDVGRKRGEEGGRRQKSRLSNTLTLISNLPCSPPVTGERPTK